MKKISKIMLPILCSCLFLACGEETYIPKPSTYLRLDFPEREYSKHMDSAGYSFEVPAYFGLRDVAGFPGNKEISFGPLNGTLYLDFIKMDAPLDEYIDYMYEKKIGEHKIKATNIEDTTFILPENDVYGTLFELQGNVATPFQFYLTDSTDYFMSGAVYFNTVPNYDSIKPVLNFVKRDIVNMITSTTWQ